MIFYIRVDGGDNLGFGHIYRMISLSKLISKKYNVIFLCLKVFIIITIFLELN